MPAGNPPPPTVPPVVVSLDIDFDGTVSWNGQVIPDHATLEADFERSAAEPVQAEFHIRPNKLVKYKYVANVLASAQRNGITKMGLVGNEQFLE
jgi:biopolymer transport protein ExbD